MRVDGNSSAQGSAEGLQLGEASAHCGKRCHTDEAPASTMYRCSVLRPMSKQPSIAGMRERCAVLTVSQCACTRRKQPPGTVDGQQHTVLHCHGPDFLFPERCLRG